ncbi:glycosyltransferase [Aromatoleum petrolei]|uniref:Glycosyl transferase UDP-glucuronosyltransferase n=1 Tax=Aromatoleum petrolei TaxID=76116 RepID=A0ABX1MWS9_9RHOO|nr:nucleotide disphospho-sugar-binding domain-containing protein [Aromatoleum petrolei]NMF90776.1 glycosyl transferase UDP-glucuronosyltransferase [Aromatoleum petrolei]QTQ35359.1 Glycosyl transferase, UDP-glucuronosyltransferase-like protein [Aromatoleum petrolei]
MRKLKVLFFAEGATLAHVARPFVLARSLDPERFEVVFARPDTFDWLTRNTPFPTRPLACQAASVFARRLEHGLPLYDLPTLRRYVADDLALIDTEQPDVIMGDFRLSLSVSARLRSIPYATICDAYWSPERPLHPPLPVLAFTRFTPIPIAEGIFRLFSPLALRLHARPIEHLRAEHGLPSLAHDLRRCYTDADLRLFANFPELFPEIGTGPHAAFIGPIAWSPQVPDDAPPRLDGTSPLIYVTMGSSGDPHVLQALLPVLEATGNSVLIASAGKPLSIQPTADRIRVFDYLPGDRVCQHARLVICNGGSPTTNQALAAGVPVLGIARNMDQFLNMQAITAFGAGLLVRSDRATTAALDKAVTRLLGDANFATCAQRLRDAAARNTPGSDLGSHLESLIAEKTRSTA